MELDWVALVIAALVSCDNGGGLPVTGPVSSPTTEKLLALQDKQDKFGSSSPYLDCTMQH
jgi:hypothetical protein